MSDTDALAALVAELHEAIDGLRQRLDASDGSTTVSAADRHAIERALDRYQVASDAMNRTIDEILARTAPRPRR